MQAPVLVSMRTNLVAAFRDFPDQTWKFLCDPSKHKECRGRIVFRKKLQYPFNVALDTRVKGVPLVVTNPRCETFNVEVVFDIYTQDIQHLNLAFDVVYVITGVQIFMAVRTTSERKTGGLSFSLWKTDGQKG